MSKSRNGTVLLRAALLGGVGLAAMLTSVPAAAQETGAMETVIVTGIRGSLQRNLDIKRESLGLVDAITAEDIGKFPDANLANALMRIPGVTTSYTSNATNNGQSTTTGQGVTITVRGFGPAFNETLFDGRVVPSGVGGRSFDFSGLSADMVSELVVLKSPDAALSAGAIGATVNVIYPKPFDHPGLTVAASASGTINVNDGRWKPNANFLISDTFNHDKFGILIAGAYSDYSTTQWQFQNWGWIGQYVAPCQMAGYTGPDCSTLSSDPTAANYSINKVNDTTKPIWWTQDYAVDWNQIHEERINARAAVQWRPTNSLLITLDANYARDDLMQDSLTYALWNNVGEMRDIVTSSYGTVTDFARFGPQDFDDVRSQQVLQTYTYGINLKWNVNDHMMVVADFAQALASKNPGTNDHVSEVSMGIGYGPSQGACQNTNPSGANYDQYCAVASYAGGTNGATYHVIQPGGHSLPYYTNIGPNGNAADFLGYDVGADGILGSHVMMMINGENRYLVNQARLEADFDYDNLKFKIGGQYIPEHYTQLSYVDHWNTNNLWQAFSGYGPDSNNYFHGNPAASAGIHLPASLFHGYRAVGDIPGWSQPAGGVIPGLPILNAYEVINYINSTIGTSVTCSSPGGGAPAYIPSIDGFNCQGVYNPSGYTGMLPKQTLAFETQGYQKLNEDNYAAYVSFATETKVADMPLKVSGGVRYEYTRLWTFGYGKTLDHLEITPGDHTAFNFCYVGGTGSCSSGDSTVVAMKNAYSYLLPNIDLNLFVTDTLHVRFDASRTMTRPPIADLKGNLNYGGRVGSLSATGGNPYELPYTSDNVDLAAEWYYAPNSYASADVFLKNITNYVVAGTTTITLPSVIDPSTGAAAVFTLQANKNGPSASIYGIELSWQHVFGDTGFGYLLNGTIVATDRPYDPYNLSVGNFGMPGLADSANFMVFYDKYGFQARLAANWRDTYLDKFGQGQASGTSFGSEPIFINGSWNLTFSTSYDITDQLSAYFEADNLTDAAYSTRGRFPDQLYSVISIGRSFTAGVHFKM